MLFLGSLPSQAALCIGTLLDGGSSLQPVVIFDGQKYFLMDFEGNRNIHITGGEYYDTATVVRRLGLDKATLQSFAGRDVVSVGEGMGTLLPMLIKLNSTLATPIRLKAYDIWYDDGILPPDAAPLVEYFTKHRDYLEKGSAQSIPRPNESVDFILSHAVQWHLDKPREALDEGLRVLRVGGQYHMAPLREGDVMKLLDHVRGQSMQVAAAVEFLEDSDSGPLYRIVFRKLAPLRN